MVTLSSLKAFLIDRKRVSLSEVAIHFDTPTEAVRPMLERWIAKGALRQCDAVGGCGKASGACSCAIKREEIFEWVV
jgi:hypothetical protein